MEQHDNGFTLIELLVAISVIGILSGIGLASYINFNRNQILVQSTRKIVQDLRLAQSLADNNQKPESCGTLNSYTFSFESSDNIYEVKADCVDPVYDQNPVKQGSIPSVFSVAKDFSVKFNVLKRGIVCSEEDICSLTISGFGKIRTIIVNPGGAIQIENE